MINNIKMAKWMIKTCRKHNCNECPFNDESICYSIIGDHKASMYSELELAKEIKEWINK
ncbi:hypothetical protein QTH49_13445 [Clostridium perfringens]|nr:hypothetical protein [Clostridium perfringens]